MNDLSMPFAALFLLKASVLLALVVAILEITRRRLEPRWRVGLARASLITLPIIFIGALFAPQIRLPLLAPSSISTETTGEALVSPLPDSNQSPSLETLHSSELDTRKLHSAEPLPVWPIGLGFLWGAIALHLLGRDGRSLRQCFRTSAASIPADSELQEKWEAACRSLGIRRFPKVRLSADTRSPRLLPGRPGVILLPLSIASRKEPAEESITLIFHHEAAHLRHGDRFWLLAARGVRSVFWWHPLVWWLVALHHHACEEAADAAAARAMRDGSSSYRKTLARLATQLAPANSPVPALFRKPGILDRLRSVDENASKRPPSGRCRFLLAAAMLGVGGLLGNVSLEQAISQENSDETNASVSRPRGLTPQEREQVRTADEFAVKAAELAGQESFNEAAEYYRRSLQLLPELPHTESRRRQYQEKAWALADRVSSSKDELLNAIETQWEKPAPSRPEMDPALSRVVIPEVDFRETPLVDTIAFLQETVAEQLQDGPEGSVKRVSISLAGDLSSDTPITLRLTNVPLAEALRYTASLGQAEVQVVAGDKLRLTKIVKPEGSLYVNVYRIPVYVFNRLSGDSKTGKSMVEALGISLEEPGSSAIYNEEKERLILRHRREAIEKFEEWDARENVAPEPTDAEASPKPEASSTDDPDQVLVRQLQEFRLPEVKITNHPLSSAARRVFDLMERQGARHLAKKFQDLPVSMYLRDEPLASVRQTTPVTAYRALELIAEDVDCRVTIRDGEIRFHPIDTVESQTFAYTLSGEAFRTLRGDAVDAKAMLQNAGFDFAQPGCAAIYEPRRELLLFRHSADTTSRVEKWLDQQAEILLSK